MRQRTGRNEKETDVEKQTGTDRVNAFPEMLKGGVIMDVVNAEQAKSPRTLEPRR
jgi:hypothetical protein